MQTPRLLRLKEILERFYAARKRSFNEITVWSLITLLAVSSGSVGYFLGDLQNNVELAATRAQHQRDLDHLRAAYEAAMAERDARLDDLARQVAQAARTSQHAATTAERAATAPKAESPTRRPQGVPYLPQLPPSLHKGG
ncbi:hypothetical protein 2A_00016 [Ralstonia phage Darius]|uniref:Uncharacterized protein n=3 Tax=Gervaisevirus TaxID=2843385 RepID=A0A345GTZ3_9CAUD|nr:hypothetical protein KMC51_gp34 [Ralstonia phage Gervaise]YP_010078794.1 hypothetical protein KMC52_gp62 [Ralstonia phage GP4]QMV32768.1 hypothetical protein 2A_00016 [Ralstonia phage Darius]UAW01018.1 hypothetical protein [Ralstonia phage RPZH3]WAX26319.1 hypothetical protein [Ralstonia phage p2110]AXG67757.1 hypothetical protein [Ralstonia phage GP4]QMV33272.1 hypothetical protein 1Ca_00034 [Ralstonia phage Gervaise]